MTTLKLKKFSKVTVLALFAAGLLSGCGGGSDYEPTENKVEQFRLIDQEGRYGISPSTIVFERTIESDQTVTCVWAAQAQSGGLSCNWDSYNDKFPVNPEK